MQFSQLKQEDQVLAIKDSFILLLEKIFHNPSILKDYAKPEECVLIEKFIAENIKVGECSCGECIDWSKLCDHIPVELEPLIDVARKEAEAQSY
jgi:hypothetical protein